MSFVSFHMFVTLVQFLFRRFGFAVLVVTYVNWENIFVRISFEFCTLFSYRQITYAMTRRFIRNAYGFACEEIGKRKIVQLPVVGYAAAVYAMNTGRSFAKMVRMVCENRNEKFRRRLGDRRKNCTIFEVIHN